MVPGGEEDRESHADQSHQNAQEMVPEGDEEKESQLLHQISHQNLQEMDLNPLAQIVQETVPGGDEPTPDQQERDRTQKNGR